MLVTSVEGIQRFQRGCAAIPRCWGNLHIHFTASESFRDIFDVKNKKEKYAINQNKIKKKRQIWSARLWLSKSRLVLSATSVAGTKQKLCSFISQMGQAAVLGPHVRQQLRLIKHI